MRLNKEGKRYFCNVAGWKVSKIYVENFRDEYKVYSSLKDKEDGQGALIMSYEQLVALTYKKDWE